MKYLIVTDNGDVWVDDETFDPDARSFFDDQKDKGTTLPIEFRYSFDKLIKRIKTAAQNITDFTLLIWNIGREDMPEGNDPDNTGLLNIITDDRLLGRKVAKVEIAGSQIYEGYHHNEANETDNRLDLTDLGGARVGEYVIAYVM